MTDAHECVLFFICFLLCMILNESVYFTERANQIEAFYQLEKNITRNIQNIFEVKNFEVICKIINYSIMNQKTPHWKF